LENERINIFLEITKDEQNLFFPVKYQFLDNNAKFI